MASADVARERGESLSDYYLQQGNPPGEWVGHGLAGLGVAGVVDERQMKNLFGDARHPDAERIERDALLRGATVEEAAKAAQLGRKFARYEEPNDHGYGQVLSGLFAGFKADHDRDPLPGPERDELRWEAARQVAQTLGEGRSTMRRWRRSWPAWGASSVTRWPAMTSCSRPSRASRRCGR